MKIKDLVVVDEELINRVIRRLDKCGCENLSEELENNIKPLETIILDALSNPLNMQSELNHDHYINNKEI